MSDFIARLGGIHDAIGTDIQKFGGFLRCEECKTIRAFGDGDQAHYLRHGWPKHCGYTMRWWTQRQIDAGEVTP